MTSNTEENCQPAEPKTIVWGVIIFIIMIIMFVLCTTGML